MSVFVLVDDKHVPLYRMIWVAATPHFCGEDDCQREGHYEVRLEQGEAVWASQQERDDAARSLGRVGRRQRRRKKKNIGNRQHGNHADVQRRPVRWRETYFVLFPAAQAAG